MVAAVSEIVFKFFSFLTFNYQCTVMTVACLSVDVYLSVCMYISETRNHTSKIHQILFACYLWPWIIFLPLAE